MMGKATILFEIQFLNISYFHLDFIFLEDNILRNRIKVFYRIHMLISNYFLVLRASFTFLNTTLINLTKIPYSNPFQ